TPGIPGMPVGGDIGVVPRIPPADGTGGAAAGPTGTHEPPDTGPRLVIGGAGGVQLGGTDRPPTEPAPPRFPAAAPRPAAPFAAPSSALAASLAALLSRLCAPVIPLIPRHTAQMLFACRFDVETSWLSVWLPSWWPGSSMMASAGPAGTPPSADCAVIEFIRPCNVPEALVAWVAEELPAAWATALPVAASPPGLVGFGGGVNSLSLLAALDWAW